MGSTAFQCTRLSSCRPTFLPNLKMDPVLRSAVCQINLGELDPSAHPNFVLKLTRAGRSDLYWTLDHARSPQRVARAPDRSHSRLHFAHSTRAISAEGCAGMGQIALSPAFRALDTHDLRRAHQTNRTRACISRTRHARSPQRVARVQDKSHSRLHFAHSTRTISAEGCAHTGQIALSPAFRALDTHDLRRGLRAHRTNRTLACISRTRHARSRQRVARTPDQSSLSPAFRALDTHDLRRGLHFRLTLFVPPSAFQRQFLKWGNVFH